MKTYFEARRRLAAMVLALPLACLAFGLMISAAFAGDDTKVPILPIYKEIVEPLLLAVIYAGVPAILGYAAYLLKKRFGIELDATMNAKIQAAAMNAAGAVVAKFEGPLGNVSIDVRSKLVKDGVDLLLSKVPDAIDHFGLTPEELAKIIQGKIGILQATGPAPAPASPAQ